MPRIGARSARGRASGGLEVIIPWTPRGGLQQNCSGKACCGFAWFNVLKPVRDGASAHEVRAAAQAAGLRLLYHGRREAAYNKTAAAKPLKFCMVQCSQARARRRIGARSARGRASGGFEVIIPWTPRSGLQQNRSGKAAEVLHGSMFSSPCATAHRRMKCARPRKRRV